MAHRGGPVAVGAVRRGDGGRIAFDSRGGENLAPAGGVERVHFVGRAGQGTDLAGAPEAPERSVGGCPPVGGPFLLVFGDLGMDEIYGDGLDADFLDVGEAGYGARGAIGSAGITRFGSIDAFVKSAEDLGGLKRGHIDEATPYPGGGETAGRET